MARYIVQDNQQFRIFGPFLAMMLLTVVVWVYMYIRRIYFIKSRNIRPDQLQRSGELARISPPDVSNPSDNLKNLFEMPVLFYALSLYLFVTNQVDSIHVTAAWIYFVLRVIHSFIHCTINIIMLRFYAYLVSCLALFLMLFRVVTSYFLL